MRADLLFLFRFHLVVYLLLLSWLMLFRPLQQQASVEGNAVGKETYSNRIEQIQSSVHAYGLAQTSQMLLIKSIRHITFFFPLGVLLVMSFVSCQTTPRLLLAGLLVSASICMVQHAWGLGPLDVDGLLFNIMGVWAGGRALILLESSSASI